MTAAVSLPRVFHIGGGAINKIGETLKTLGVSRPLLVSDSFLAQSGLVERVVAALTESGASEIAVYTDTVPDPTIASIELGIQRLKEGRHDCVIGLGGGSPMDTAKAIAVMGVHGGDARAYRFPHIEEKPGLPIVAVPTTAGTGSEATRFTVITDETNNEKMLCAGLAYLPVAAIVDYQLTLTMGARLAADTGIDALTHAIEAYVSQKANIFSDDMALLAIGRIGPNLRRACLDPDAHEQREAIAYGATLAGMAFSNASVALVHGMSRPLGAHFHIAHGLSNAMLLPAVTAFSVSASMGRYARCALAMKLGSADDTDQVLAGRLVAELLALNQDLNVPTPSALGIDAAAWESKLDVMAEQAIASGSPSNNPRIPTADQIKSLYRQVYNTQLSMQL